MESDGKTSREWWVLSKHDQTDFNQGKCRAIGVSNYTIGHLEELFGYSTVVPQVNQVEFHVISTAKKFDNFESATLSPKRTFRILQET